MQGPMVQAAPAGTAAPAPPRRGRFWLGPLLAGLCFGLGYGLTQRLLVLNVPGLVRFGQPFDLQPFPGTGLGSLRLRFGDEAQQIRGSLELDQLQRQPAAPPPEDLPPEDPATEGAPPPGPAEAVPPEPGPEPAPAPAAAERTPPPAPGPGAPTAPVPAEPPPPAPAPAGRL